MQMHNNAGAQLFRTNQLLPKSTLSIQKYIYIFSKQHLSGAARVNYGIHFGTLRCVSGFWHVAMLLLGGY